jgi:hypothetical protein
MNTEEKRIYIYENIEEIKNSQIIFEFIKRSKIEYSKNQNGIFFNLSCLDEKIVDDFYNHLCLLKNNEVNEESYNKLYEGYSTILFQETENNLVKESIVDDNYKKIKLNKLQKDIIDTIN